jgi:multidrug resistance efflux pump
MTKSKKQNVGSLAALSPTVAQISTQIKALSALPSVIEEQSKTLKSLLTVVQQLKGGQQPPVILDQSGAHSSSDADTATADLITSVISIDGDTDEKGLYESEDTLCQISRSLTWSCNWNWAIFALRH